MPRSSHKKGQWKPPNAFAEYQILWSLGRGGMGEVFLGHDKLLERPVAIKFLSTSGQSPQENIREQYLAEARAAARLQHPNVVTVYSVGEIEGRPYIVSEYLQGPNLDNLHKPMPWPKALDLGVRLARGLAAAHKSGVLHLDIKPGNAILTETGELKLLDFGLAKCVERALPLIVPPTEVKEAIADTMDVSSENASVSQRDSGDVANEAAGQAVPADSGEAKAVSKPSPRDTRRLSDMPPPNRIYQSGKYKQVDIDPAGWASTIQGTPHYMAPEVLLGRQATRASDVYSLGAVLFELCAGVTPHYDIPMDQVRTLVPEREAPPLLHVAPSVHPRFAAIVDRCLRRFSNERYPSAEEVRDALEQLLEVGTEKELPEGNPYRGMLAYEPEHAAFFFGRQGEIGTLIERMRTEACVLVAGDPGVGKSSLCRAGLLPYVHSRGLTGERTWKSAIVVPGRLPIDALSRAVSTALSCPEDMLLQVLRKTPNQFAQVLSNLQGPHRGLLLFIDQLEELLTVADPAEATALAEAVGSLMRRAPEFRVLLAVRRGALERMGTMQSMAQLTQIPTYDLRPITADGIREIITSPALAKGVRFDPSSLVTELAERTMASEGGLPLLQVVLAELWEARKGSLIDTSSLESINGFSGALNRHADHVLGRLSMEQRVGARTILTALVSKERRALRKNGAELLALASDLQPVLDSLTRGRLLSVIDSPEGPTYGIASSTLCDSWRTLAKWIDEPATMAHKIITPPRPAELSRYRPDRRSLALTAAPLLLLIVYGATIYRMQRQRNQQVERLVQAGREARRAADRNGAVARIAQQQGFAALVADRRTEADELWRRAQQARDSAESDYRNASHSLERALNMDGSRSDLRALLADILLSRVLLADGDQAAGLRSDLLERLALYDEGGERQRMWNRPGRLLLECAAPGATVQIARFHLNPQNRWETQAPSPLGTTPLSQVELVPGNYLLTLSADGYSTVRQPVLVEHGNEVKVKAELMPAKKHE